MRVALTGANGYLGNHLGSFLSKRGISIVPMVRSNGFELNGSYDFPLDIDVLIHSAHDFKVYGHERNLQLNVQGALKLFRKARQGGVQKILFISSIAAFIGCKSIYGKSKLAIENEGRALGVTSIRPGTIYGGMDKGVFGTLKKISELPFFILPADGRQKIYLVHIDDLSEEIYELINNGNLHCESPMLVAYPQPISIFEILSFLNSGSKVAIKIPIIILLAACRILETILKGNSPLRSDSLISLLNPNPLPIFDSSCNRLRAFKPQK